MNKPLTDRELEAMFIELMQERGDDEVKFGACTYSKIEMVKDHDPICFREEFLNWIDQELDDDVLTEIDGAFYLTCDLEEV